MTQLANTIFADGPTVNPLQPPKSQIRQWGTYLESLANLAFTSGRVYASKAALLADLTPGANLSALVIGDATAGNDGLYMKNGGTGTGSWTQLLDFVPGTQFVDATDAGAGTANAIQATTDIALSATGRQIVALSIFENNTGAATVRFNGTGPVYPIKTNSGADVAANYLLAGSEVLGRLSGSVFKLFTDVASSADRAAAEAAAAAASASAAAAAASAAAINLPSPAANTLLVRNAGNSAYDAKPFADVRDLLDVAPYVADRTALAALDVTKDTVAVLKEAGREGIFIFSGSNLSSLVTADPQQGLYVAPASASTGASGAWVRQLDDLGVLAKWFGASPSASAAANVTAIQAAINMAKTRQGSIKLDAGTYSINALLDISACSNVSILGEGTGTVISTTSATAQIFYASGVTTIDGFSLSNLRLTSSTTRTGTTPFIQVDPMLQFSYITNVVADAFNSFMWLKQFVQVQIRGCKAYQMASPPTATYGIRAGTQSASNQGANLYIRDTILRGKGSGSATVANWTVGLLMHDVEAVFTHGLDIGDFDSGARGDPSTRLANCFFDSSFFDATQRGASFAFLGAGIKVDIEFCASWFASAGRSGTPTAADGAYGFLAAGSGSYGRMMFTGCRFYNNAGNGVAITAADFDGDFVGCNFYFNSVVDSGPAFVNQTTGNAPNLKSCKFTSNGGGATAISYGSSSAGYVAADINCDANVSFGGTPKKLSNIVATNNTGIASAATVTLLPFGEFLTITGTTTITGFAASTDGRVVTILFSGILTVTHGANLVLKGATNATTASGSIMTFAYNGSGNWREVSRNF